MKTDIEGVVQDWTGSPRSYKQRFFWMDRGEWFMIGLGGIEVQALDAGKDGECTLRITSETPGSGDLHLELGERVQLCTGVFLQFKEVDPQGRIQIRYIGSYEIPVFSAEEYKRRQQQDHWREDPG